MDDRREKLKKRLYANTLYTSLIQQSYEVDGVNKQGFLYYLMARGTSPLRIDGGRCEGCFGLRPRDYKYVSADLAGWGMPGASVRQIKGFVRQLRGDGLIATAVRRGNGAPRGTIFAVVNWSKFDDSGANEISADFNDLRRAIVKAFEVRFRKTRVRQSAPSVVPVACAGEPKCQPAGPEVRHESGRSADEVKDQKGPSGDGVKYQSGPSYSFKTTRKEKIQAGSHLVFCSGQLKITRREDEAFRDAFGHVGFPAEYERMAAWLVANPQKLAKPGVFVFRWLARIPVPTPKPEGMLIPAAERIERG